MMKNLQKNAMSVLYGTGGAIGGKFVRNKLVPHIPFVKDKPDLAGLVPVLVGIYLMDNKNAALADVGFGMAVSSVADIAVKKIPTIGEITGDDFEAVADEVLEGLDDEINDVLELGDELADDDESVNDEVLEDELADDELSDDYDEIGDEIEELS